MPWVVLVASAVLEAVWASALSASAGLSRPLPSVVFVVAGTLSMVGLAHAVRSVPVGTAYAVWTGLGAALTVGWATATGGEAPSLAKLLLVTGIVASVAGLKVVGGRPGDASGAAAGDDGRRARG